MLLKVRRACQAISGILNEGMRRDDGHAFMVVGRMLERSIFTVGLLEASHSDSRGVMDATRMLRLTSSLQAYHRQHGNAPDFDGVVALPAACRRSAPISAVVSRRGRGVPHRPGIVGHGPGSATPKGRLLRARLELGEVEEAMAAAPGRTLVNFGAGLAELAGDVQAGILPPLARATVRSQYVRPGHGGEGAGR